jgi:hypothetical protein
MRAARLSRIAALSAAGLLVSGCGGDSGTGPTALQVALFANPASIPVDGSSLVIAQVTTDMAQPAAGVPLEWGTTFGELVVTGATQTDANGRRAATLRGTGTAGVAVVTARVVGREYAGQVQVQIGPN